MSSYFDTHAEQLRLYPGALLEIEEKVWADVLRVINIRSCPKKYKQAALKIKEMYMYKSTYEDEFTLIQKEGYARNGKSLFIEKMHDLFHEVREFGVEKRIQNGQKYNYDWEDVHEEGALDPLSPPRGPYPWELK